MNPNIYFYIGIGVVVVILILMYNSLIYRKNQIENIKGSIDALLKKRFDLIPNLVKTVKEYMNYEKDVLEKITELRSMAIKESDLNKKMEYENQLNNLLSKLFVNVENYPELKASQNFLQLQNELSDIESQIAAARRAYNQVVTDYNNAIEMFPTNIMAKFMHLQREKVFEIPENERKNIDVGDIFGN